MPKEEHQAGLAPIDPLKKGSNTPYLVAIVVMTLIGVVAVMTIILLRPDADNTQLITTIVGMLMPTTAAILALMKSQETHLTVNSQLAQWKVDFAGLQRAEGEKAGVIGEQARIAEQKKNAAAQRPVEAPPLVAGVVVPVVPTPVVVVNDDPVPVIETSDGELVNPSTKPKRKKS